MSNSAVERAISEIAARAEIPLERCTVTWGASDYHGFRPFGLDEGQGFSVALARTVYRAQAFFVADRFAGPLLRHIGSHDAGDIQWQEIVEEGERLGIRSDISVDDMPLSDDTFAGSAMWRSLEIECSTRIPITATTENVDDLVAVGEQCLTLVLAGVDLADLDSEWEGEAEAESKRVMTTRYERSPANRVRCIRNYGTRCWVCDLMFEDVYGPIGRDFIEVHHRVPVSELPPGYRVDPVRDLIPLCSNCHSMIHKRTPIFQPDELRQIVGLSPKALPAPSILPG